MTTIALPFPGVLFSKRNVLIVILLAAIAGAYALSLTSRATVVERSYAPIPMANGDLGYKAAAPAGSPGAGRHGPASTPSNSLPSNIIRTGDITLKLSSKTVLGAQQRLAEMLRAFPGSYVAGSSSYDHNRYLDLQLEVPAGQFTAVFHRLQTNFGKVEAESTTTEDVGLRVVDLSARLKNLMAQRIALLKLFSRAATVGDTIRVENVLSGVEGQIEQTQGQIKYLDHQISMSAISVEFQAKNATKKHHHSPTNQVIAAFGTAGNGILNVIAGAIIVVGYAIPLAALGLGLFGLVLLALRILHRRRPAPAPATA